MASTEGPTAAISQAVNLSVSESMNKVQNEPTPVSSNSANSTTSSSPAPASEPEKPSKPIAETSDCKTLSTPTVTNSSDIPAASPSQKVQDSSAANSAPVAGDSNCHESTTETEMDTSDAPEVPTSGDAGTTKPTEKLDNSSLTKAADSQSKEIPEKSCDTSATNESKANCENPLPVVTTQENTPTPEDKKSEKISTDGPASTATNGGPSVTEVPAQSSPVSKPIATIKPMVELMNEKPTEESKQSPTSNETKPNNKRPAEDSDEPEKRLKTVSSSPPHPSSSSGYKGSGKTSEQILEYMEKTFEHRRKIITKQMPTIPELKELYPDLFRDKQLVIEFQRITKIDIDQKIQEFCVRNATAVIEMARSKKGAQGVLARWEQAKQENEALKQYWDMVTALCLLPLHFGENFVEMVLEIDEDEEVQAQGKIVPTLVARGNIFRTDEFFLIAENTIVQEFEEFTIAFASLYSSYWVFNMVYPETIENTYNFIQRCIVKQKEPGAIPTVCKNFTKTLQKWNKSMKKT